MPLSQEAIQKILGIKEKVSLIPEEMADKLNITFYPYDENKINSELKNFIEKLKKTLVELKVNIVPYEESLTSNYFFLIRKLLKGYLFVLLNNISSIIIGENDPLIPTFYALSKIRIGKKIKRGIAIIAVGENSAGNLPIDNTSSFVDNPIITIVNMPEGIDSEVDFHKHFDTAMNLFAHHMTHIVIAVNKDKWLLYNFNASHPIYSIDDDFKPHILYALIPKIAAPIKPPKFSEFILISENFDPFDGRHKTLMEDMIKSGSLLEKTGLYPPGKSISSLPFRNEFYNWIGKLHLDGRSGMSYGFLARQLPLKLPKLIPFEEAKEKYKNLINLEKDYFIYNNKIFIIIEIFNNKFYLEIPDVWVITQRSGSMKTQIDPKKDILKMGLVNGAMILETPIGSKFSRDYKPSFDTRVILANAVGNAIVGAILLHLNPNNNFSNALQKNGLALSHWHGYFKKELIPNGWHIHGFRNPHVSCSSLQSAIYALDGKLRALEESLKNHDEYLGDIHIEPQHGSNITFNSLEELGVFLTNNPKSAKLGNEYLNQYN